jgi:zinc transporter 1/2/3
MIGVTLGAGSGAGWTTLLIVIVFHQFFEGLAYVLFDLSDSMTDHVSLGARIALLQWISTLRALVMGMLFTVSQNLIG